MTLSLWQKAEICSKLDKGMSIRHLASEYNVSNSTISNIRKQKNNIRKDIFNPCTTHKSTGIKKSSRNKLEIALNEWILNEATSNISLSNKMLKDKAKQLYQDFFGIDNFKAGDKWLRNFKQRYNVLLKTKSREFNDETASVISKNSMESASVSLETERKSTPLPEKIDNNSNFVFKRHELAFEIPSYDFNKGTNWKKFASPEDYSDEANSMLTKHNDPYSESLISNKESDEKVDENAPSDAYSESLKSYSTMVSNQNGDGCSKQNSKNVKS